MNDRDNPEGLRDKRIIGIVLCVVILTCVDMACAMTAREILETTDVKGGLIVHLGSEDGKLTAELCANDSYIVHGLDTNMENVKKARQYISSLGIYGRVSVAKLDGTVLPYAENMVNLLVSQDICGVSMDEIMRVLVPKGVAYIKQNGKWRLIIKPWPTEIDEWTHRMHDASGNAVAKDRIVGSPRRLKWKADPEWMRHHDLIPPCAMVSAGGRVFYINSEGPIEAQAAELAGHRWFLYARDAFNGALLWKRLMPDWGWQEWSTRWLQRYNIPYQLPKRLVAIGDRVYVTLSFNAPLSALDGATGRVLKTYDEAGFVDEILYLNDRLILSSYTTLGEPGNKSQVVRKSVCVVEPYTGKVLWKKDGFEGVKSMLRWINPFTRLELCAGSGRIFLLNADKLIVLDLKSGKELWQTPRPEKEKYLIETVGNDMCTLVCYKDVVLFAQLDPINSNVHHFIPGCIYSFSAKDGRLLWRNDDYGAAVYHSQPGVFVIDDLVWFHEHQWPDGVVGKKSRFVNSEDFDYKVFGVDPVTGKIKKAIHTEKIFNVGHHHRCHRNVATERFLLTGRRGVELIDVTTGKIEVNSWARGTCLLGYVPCNGMIYIPPHPCQCYMNAKINGFNALAPLASGSTIDRRVSVEERLEKGPAYSQLTKSEIRGQDDWPTYRHDSARSGSSKTTVPAQLKETWKVELGGKLSAPVAADSRVYVAAVDTHTVYALDAKSGKKVWYYIGDGKVDSPPTIYRGLVLFGTRNGWVYCLRETDGKLVWRFLAAPEHRLIGAYGRLESAWPVLGSVLIQDGRVYCAAGRNTYLDGGIDVYALDPYTGELLESKHYCDLDFQTGESPKTDSSTMPGARNDILVGSDDSVFMRHVRIFGQEKETWTDGKPRSNEPSNPYDYKRILPKVYQGPEPNIHMIASNGFLDDSYFSRTAMSIGISYGQLVVHNLKIAYGLQAYPTANRNSVFSPGKAGYRLFSSKVVANKEPWSWHNYLSIGRTKFEAFWSVQIPVRAKAMVLADEILFICGQPDVLDPECPLAAFEGRKGVVLWSVSATDGKKLAELELDSAPVFDGLIAAEKRLFASITDGTVRCFGKK